MAKREELEIEIRKDGEVKVHVKGVKGKKCLQYSDIFKEIVGEIKEQICTSEFYEPEPEVGIHISEEEK